MQSALCESQVEPPSAELVSAMKGDGHCFSHPGGATPYRVVSRYAWGAPGSVATAGSQSSVDELRIRDPTQPVAGRVVFATGPPNLPLALAWLSASRRSAVSAPHSIVRSGLDRVNGADLDGGGGPCKSGQALEALNPQGLAADASDDEAED